ncbi:MAG: bifunctional phosphoribosylaminoimidazolecarboxamide formyltransferase/IMP cyclohydrolase [Methanosaeta sp. PtaB.Bin018]|jgi:phosphoribosylaminoimidazolecarboxamide formyltransferase/IMP cyclohydrolase|nr:MAG: bifunctional phosphoribosylaminoimidazolecarboxamide formyltransferase/IMP cyclohydrolase [Methanosaeta sp. PtaB.Bin018]OPY47380.1 MAG: bifunctional phosphoribosylaminoimidazolecarboxamide formyltransferase/IMP cyclohydrolase [Methanosaeta sp. PtaU1.Bin016]
MRIKQVVVLADPAKGPSFIPSGLEQLGLQICDRFPSDGSGLDLLLICGEGFEETPSGSALIHQALSCGCPIVLDPQRCSSVVEEIKRTGCLCKETRDELAAWALYKCLQSDAQLLAALQGNKSEMPRYVVTAFEKVQDLRYGENWHQKAALYRKKDGLGLHRAKKLNGREMSYNNMVDAETVLEMLMDLSHYDGVRVEKPLSVIVKHANPCGVAYGNTLQEAYRLSFATDPKSAFGGVIGFNRPVDENTARAIGDSFVEVLLAPGFDPKALKLLTEKKPNRRILDIGDLLQRREELYRGHYLRSIFGGMMLQDYDTGDISEWKVVTKRSPTDYETRALRFAWKVAKYVKSNALVYTSECQTVGIGSGQVSRVDSARFGAEKAEEHGLCTLGTVAATDSFFPFRDGLDEAFKAGATAVIHPGGSIRDAEVIDAADEHGMAMVFTGMRHFRH